jgi:polysaccharide biosynthesis transport protein
MSERVEPGASATGTVREPIGRRAAAAVQSRLGLFITAACIAFGVLMLTVISATLITFILPEAYMSKARIALRSSAAAQLPPAAIRTECEVIRSEAVLGQTVEALDLNQQWGQRYGNGERLRTIESVQLLRARSEARPVSGTALIEIATYSERPDEAANLANAIAEAYRQYATRAGAGSAAAGALRVELIDKALPAVRPARPNKPLNISLGIVMGLGLGLLAGGGVWGLGLLFSRRGHKAG